MKSINVKNYKEGLRDGVPIALGYLAVAFTLGIAARNFGIHAFPATIMSLTNFTSAGEFAALGIISAGAPYLEMVFSQAIINLRYLLMSCSLSQKFSPDTKLFHRFLVGYDVTDEICGVADSEPGLLNPFYNYGMMTLAIPGWALGTFLGVIMGNVLPAGIVSALSVGLYGMFIAIIIPPARKSRILAVLIAISMTASYIFSKLPLAAITPGIRTIILTVVIAGIAAVLFPVREEEASHAE